MSATWRKVRSGRLPLLPAGWLLRSGFLRRLLASDRHQHLPLARCRLARLFRRLLRSRGLGGSAADTPTERLHQVNDVFAPRPLLGPDRLAGALLVDELDQSSFIMIFELLGLERSGLLIDDMLGQIEH